MPTFLQASISSVPAGAETAVPSTVRVTSFAASAIGIRLLFFSCKNRQLSSRRPRLLKRARLSFQMIFKFFAKLLDDRNGRQGRRIAQRAKRPTQHVLRQILNIIDVFLNPAASVESAQCLLQPISPFPAGNA